MRWSLLLTILPLLSVTAQDSTVFEKVTSPQDEQHIAPTTKREERDPATKKTDSIREKTRASESVTNPLLNVTTDAKDERELQDSLISKMHSLNGGALTEQKTKRADDEERIWEDFKWPLLIIAGLLVYFIPTLLGMRRNDFKKVFLVNLLLGSTVGGAVVCMNVMPFPMQWLYIWTGVSWALALVPLFLKDCAPPSESEGRRRHRSSRRHRRH